MPLAQGIKIVPSVDTLTIIGSCTPAGFLYRINHSTSSLDRIVVFPRFADGFRLGPPPSGVPRYDSLYFEISDSIAFNHYEILYNHYSLYEPKHMKIPSDSVLLLPPGQFDITLIVLRNGVTVDSARQRFISYQTGLGVKDQDFVSPQTSWLFENYPNPFNPSTTIEYRVAHNEHVFIAVYNILSQEVAALVNENKTVGSYSLQFNASNLSSGTYFCRSRIGEVLQTRKLMLIR
jgi:hypothetical protein